jgi:hypothetical protein
VSVMCCQRSLRRAVHLARGVLPTVVRRWVWSRNLFLCFISVLDRGEWSDWRPDSYPKGLPKCRYWPLGTRVYDCSCRNSDVESLSALLSVWHYSGLNKIFC